MSEDQGPTAGLGLKPQHYAAAYAAHAPGLWFEVHPENYFSDGGPRLAWLEAVRSDHALSLHGVGLSLAADEDPDPAHLAALRRLADRFEPFLFSEHLAWSTRRGEYRPDLLPFPRSHDALNRVVGNVMRTQDALGREIAVENPSLYLDLEGHDLGEAEFLSELVRRSGCGLLVDVNNLFVSASNLGFQAESWLDALPAAAIREIHLAGHAPDPEMDEPLLIDTHGAPVSEAVWRLFERLIDRIGPRPTLIERDQDLPAFAVLMEERDRADAALAQCRERACA